MTPCFNTSPCHVGDVIQVMSCDVIPCGLQVTGRWDIRYDTIAAVVAHVCSLPRSGAVLIFMPGLAEIKQCVHITPVHAT